LLTDGAFHWGTFTQPATIPLAFVYYFRKFPVTPYKASLKHHFFYCHSGLCSGRSDFRSCFLAAGFDLFFVNSLGLPFNTGIILFSILAIGAIVWGLKYTARGISLYEYGHSFIHLSILGYFNLCTSGDRSLANPPWMKTILKTYITFYLFESVSKYGERPLLYGHITAGA